jgi:uncharacterized membrane protein
VLPLGFVIVAFLAFSIPPYLGLDPAKARVPATFALHYPIMLVHIGCGAVAMVTGFLQIWPWFRRRYPVAHRRLGRVYVFAGVLPAGLAGLVIGAMSPFGPVAATSNVILASLWLTCTVTAYRRARQRRFGEHRKWMIRSYALTASTITNRFWGPMAAIVFTPQLDTTFGGSEIALMYTVGGLSTWLGWTIPLIVVEWWLTRQPRRAVAR